MAEKGPKSARTGKGMTAAESRELKSSASKKGAIMRAAVKLFLEQGYHDTSLRQIALESDSSASLIIYHFGTKQAIAVAYLEEKMHTMRTVLMQMVDIRSDPELFCCTFVLLYQTVMASDTFCRFYHNIIEEGVFQSFFFESDSGINVSDLILAKRQVSLPPSLYTFYSHYIIPGIELASWISAGDQAPCAEKLELPFRTLMGIIYVSKEEVDAYCCQAKTLVQRILTENPQFMEP